jgi:CP12 domain
MLYTPVQEAIADAQRICAMDPTSGECRVAWDIVEELEAADSHMGILPAPVVATDFLSLVEGFDILVERIDHKMDRLIATTDSLAELGVTDAAITSLYDRAEDMKRALMHARNTLRDY